MDVDFHTASGITTCHQHHHGPQWLYKHQMGPYHCRSHEYIHSPQQHHKPRESTWPLGQHGPWTPICSLVADQAMDTTWIPVAAYNLASHMIFGGNTGHKPQYDPHLQKDCGPRHGLWQTSTWPQVTAQATDIHMTLITYF